MKILKIRPILLVGMMIALAGCTGINRFAIQGPDGDTVGMLNSTSDSTDIFTPANKTEVLVTKETCGGQPCVKTVMAPAAAPSPAAQVLNPAAEVGSAAILGLSFPKPAGTSVTTNVTGAAAAAAAAAAASSSSSSGPSCISC